MRKMTCLAIVAIWALAAGPAMAQQKIGVVDIVKIFNNCEEVKVYKDDLDRQRDAADKEALEREKKINAPLLARDSQYKPGSPEYLQKTKEAIVLQYDLKSFKSSSTQYLLIQHQMHTQRIYAKIVDEIAAYAKANGFELVLAMDEISLEDAKSFQEVLARIAQRKILYRADAIDLTDIVLKRVNDKYKAGSGG
jgi:Skp family chaperone for outer membrane proteins